MPYFISDQNPDCSGWAVEKEDGEVIGCHQTKQDAIDQMVAVSIAEGMEPGGERQVDLDLPAYIRDAAARGLEFYEQGLGGDGLVERTIREARLMARGEVSDDKVIRANAWGARHEPDLRADGARPGEDGFPTPGAVAHYLWGIPTDGRYDDARAWFARKAEQIREDEGRTMIEATPVEPRSEGSGVEFRSVVGEIRAEDGGRRFVGYAAVFNSDSEPLPFTERILPGAFAKSLRNRRRDVRAYVNHDSNMVLASTRSKTLTLVEDDRGLRVEFELPDTTYARDLANLMASGIVDKMSFGFTVPRGGDRWSDDGTVRELREIALHEVSVVTGHPAYTGTAAAVRSLDGLAQRTGLAVADLSAALDAIADGEQVSAEVADALVSAIGSLTVRPEPDLSLLALKAKQTELLAKKVV